ncbi:MAG: MFS transporter [Pirellulales bacterium]|nr:MFS transporter [Pirellulales bacterium]
MNKNPRLGAAQWLVLAAAFLGWMFDGLEMGLFPIAARPALLDLMSTTDAAGQMVPPDEALVGEVYSYLVALFLVGAAAGGFLFGWMGDRIGRVRTMALSIATYAIFTGLCALATAPWHLGACRFLAALGMGGEWSLGVALVMECWPERFRPILAGVIGAAANVGFLAISVLGALVAVTPDQWRWIMVAGAAPGLLAILVVLFIPESQRWKDSVKKRVSQPLREVFSGDLLKPTVLAIVFASVALIPTWGAVSGFLPLWVDQMAGKENPYAKGQIQIVVSIGAILGCLIGPLMAKRLGRRPAFFLLCVGSLASCAVLFRTMNEYNLAFIAVTAVVGLLTASFYGWLPLYLPELFPTRVRATGQGIAFNSGRILAAAGALTTGKLMGLFDGSYPRACAAITLVYVVGMALIWLAPETKGKPLPE